MATRQQNQEEPPREEGADRAGQQARDAVKSVAGEVRQTLRGELTNVMRDAAIEVLTPVARKATTTAAKYAVTRGPELVKDMVATRLKDAGGPMELAKGMAGAAGQRLPKLGGRGEKGGGDGGGPEVSGTGRGRRLPVQEYIDIAVPADVAYDQWTQFEDFPSFMRGVEQIEQRDDTTLVWHEKLWGVRRSWVAEITDQRPSERIAWHSTSGPTHVGVVTFHQLADRLTRVQVTLDHQPTGLFERTASGMRSTRRALKSDLKRFKAFIEMSEEPTGAWRGRVEEGEVAEEEREPAEDREAAEEEEEERGGARDEEAEPEQAEEGEEPEEAEEPEPASARRRRSRYEEDEDEEDDGGRERPRPRRRAGASRR